MIRSLTLAAGLALAAAAPAAAQAAPRQVEAARRAAREMLARGIPGLSAAVAVDGRVVWSEGFGLADLEQNVPVSPATRFRVGSVAKPLTAAALMRLRQEGRMDLDAPVTRYVPEFPDKGAPITPRMLAGHLGGIRWYAGDEFFLNRAWRSLREGLSIFAADPLVAPPGTKYSYSSYGFNLLGAAMEAADGREFTALMSERVLVPLGLKDTVPDRAAEVIDRRARFYVRTAGGAFANAPAVDSSHKWPSGGYLSTAEDLARFGAAMSGTGFLDAESLGLMFAQQRTKAGQETGYGLGWEIATGKDGARRVGHEGRPVGGSAVLVVYPGARVAAAVLVNVSDAPVGRDDASALAELFMNGQP